MFTKDGSFLNRIYSITHLRFAIGSAKVIRSHVIIILHTHSLAGGIGVFDLSGVTLGQDELVFNSLFYFL